MAITVFGLELPEELATGWEETAHVVVGAARDDGSIDFSLLLGVETLRYLATGGASDVVGIVEAPSGFARLVSLSKQVLESGEPVLRSPTIMHEGFLLTVFPVFGVQGRIVAILEPDAASSSGELRQPSILSEGAPDSASTE